MIGPLPRDPVGLILLGLALLAVFIMVPDMLQALVAAF